MAGAGRPDASYLGGGDRRRVVDRSARWQGIVETGGDGREPDLAGQFWGPYGRDTGDGMGQEDQMVVAGVEAGRG